MILLLMFKKVTIKQKILQKGIDTLCGPILRLSFSVAFGILSYVTKATEHLGAENDLKRPNMATNSKCPLPPRPQSVPLLRKTMSPDPTNAKSSPTRSKTPLVRLFCPQYSAICCRFVFFEANA